MSADANPYQAPGADDGGARLAEALVGEPDYEAVCQVVGKPDELWQLQLFRRGLRFKGPATNVDFAVAEVPTSIQLRKKGTFCMVAAHKRRLVATIDDDVLANLVRWLGEENVARCCLPRHGVMILGTWLLLFSAFDFVVQPLPKTGPVPPVDPSQILREFAPGVSALGAGMWIRFFPNRAALIAMAVLPFMLSGAMLWIALATNGSWWLALFPLPLAILGYDCWRMHRFLTQRPAT